MPDDAVSLPPDEVAAAVDHVGISRLLSGYADAVTRRDWDVFDGLFLADCVVDLDLVSRPSLELVGPDAMAEFVAGAIERFEFFEFVVLNHHVDLWPGGDRAAAAGRVFMCELRQVHGETTPHRRLRALRRHLRQGRRAVDVRRPAATARWAAGPRASCSR